MKLVYFVNVLLYSISFAVSAASDSYDIVIQPQWKKLDADEQKAKQFGGPWILAGDITFKNKSNEVIKLDAFDLRWFGSEIKKLSATLFKKDECDQVIPTQENVICDGYWSNKEQTLKFRFDHKYTLSALNNFYLVFTVPQYLEGKLKSGCFIMTKSNLPYQYQLALQNEPLTLSYTRLENTPARKSAVIS